MHFFCLVGLINHFFMSHGWAFNPVYDELLNNQYEIWADIRMEGVLRHSAGVKLVNSNRTSIDLKENAKLPLSKVMDNLEKKYSCLPSENPEQFLERGFSENERIKHAIDREDLFVDWLLSQFETLRWIARKNERQVEIIFSGKRYSHSMPIGLLQTWIQSQKPMNAVVGNSIFRLESNSVSSLYSEKETLYSPVQTVGQGETFQRALIDGLAKLDAVEPSFLNARILPETAHYFLRNIRGEVIALPVLIDFLKWAGEVSLYEKLYSSIQNYGEGPAFRPYLRFISSMNPSNENWEQFEKEFGIQRKRKTL